MKMGKCKVCGKTTMGNYEFCMNCKPKSANPPSSGGYSTGYKGGSSRGVPPECIFKDSFYEADGYLKKEIFMDAAEKMATIFQAESMTQTSIRHLFNMLKAIEMRMKTNRDLPLGFIRENFYKFVTHTEYQTKRAVIKDVFRDFVESHSDIAVKNKNEFRGFVQYLTAIVARMKQK